MCIIQKRTLNLIFCRYNIKLTIYYQIFINQKMIQRKQAQQQISQFSKKLPFAFSIMLFVFIGVMVGEIFYGSTFLYCNFQNSVLTYQVHRIFFSFFRDSSLLAAVVAWWHLATFLPKFQVKNGSIIVFFQFFVTNLIIQFLVLSVQALFFYIQEVKNTLEPFIQISLGSGILGIFINIYYKYVYFNLQPKKRYYVPFLAIVLCFLSWEFRLDVFFGIQFIIKGLLLGLIQCHCFKGGIMFFSADSYSQKDRCIFRLKCNKILRNWIRLNPQSIKINDLCVVQARQFYHNIKQNSIYMQAGQKMKQAEIQVQGYQLQPRAGKNQKTQKWQECQIIQNQE